MPGSNTTHINRRPLSDEESSDLPERISLPRHAPKQQPMSKKPKVRPEDVEAVSYSSDSDKEMAKKAQTSGKRLSFGSLEVEDKAAARSTEAISKRIRRPSEKALYMAEANTSESDVQKSPSKDRKSIATSTTSKVKEAHVSDSWEEWSDSKSVQLSKNDRNAAPSKGSPKEERSQLTGEVHDHGTSANARCSGENIAPTPTKRNKEIEPSSSRGRVKRKLQSPSPSDSSVVEMITKRDDPVTPKKRVKPAEPSSKHRSRERARSPSSSPSNKRTVPKRDRNDDNEATSKDHSSASKSKIRGRARSLSPSPSISPSSSKHARKRHDNDTMTAKKHGSASKSKNSRRTQSLSPSPSISPSRAKRDWNDEQSVTPKKHGSSSKGKDRGRARSLSPSPSNSPSVHKGERDQDNTGNPEKHRKDTDRPSSSQKNKGKARARSLSPSFSAGLVESETSERKEEKREINIEDVEYPAMPTSCKAFSGYIHLPHTFTLEGRTSNLLSPAAFYDDMEKRDRGRFLDALNFTREGFFINPSRSRLNNLNVNKAGRFVFGRDDNALMLFNGAVAYCSLVEPTSVNGANVRCISVYPFSDDFAQWKNFVASVVQKTDFITTTDNDVVSFMSKKENNTEENGSSRSQNEPVSSPKKAGKFFQNNLKAGEATRQVSYAGRIPHMLSFNEKVPIFDARDSDFHLQKHYKEVGGLPYYKGGTEDLPQFAVVTVGHTMSTFAYNPDRTVTALQLNVIFVILHGFVKD